MPPKRIGGRNSRRETRSSSRKSYAEDDDNDEIFYEDWDVEPRYNTRRSKRNFEEPLQDNMSQREKRALKRNNIPIEEFFEETTTELEPVVETTTPPKKKGGRPKKSITPTKPQEIVSEEVQEESKEVIENEEQKQVEEEIEVEQKETTTEKRPRPKKQDEDMVYDLEEDEENEEEPPEEKPKKKAKLYVSDDDEFTIEQVDQEEEEDDDILSEEENLTPSSPSSPSPRYQTRRRSLMKRKSKQPVEEDDDEERYSLRPRTPMKSQPIYEESPKNKPKSKKHYDKRPKRYNEESSSSEDERLMIGKSQADINPMFIDKSITWESIGGLHSHIEALKEMILLPLLYPEIFTKFNITAPKGVLFFGPPGCGKTLMARALANTCSNAGQPVAFYMRKGADVLSKWVGEAEKQLKLLFEEARKTQPSIIFFDEIDGLAPTRSSKNDQHTGSIVSTLLALMDGLDSRGNVIVIGATNRIDAIDPALRRPGRFDRELTFKLPSKSDRGEIFNIHTKDWVPTISNELKEFISEKTVGYCGADIKALCTEAALFSLKRSYPQIYKSQDKLLIDIDQVKVSKDDFIKAMKRIVPAAHRNSVVHGRPMPMHLNSLLNDELQNVSKLFKKDYENGVNLYRPWLLIHGNGNMGQNYISRALLYDMEQLPTFSIGLPTLLSSSFGREEALIQNFAEARKNVPSIIWIPDIHVWWEKSTELMKSSLITLMNDIPSTLQVFVLASSEQDFNSLPEEVRYLFKDCNYNVDYTNEKQRREMFKQIEEDVKKKPEIELPLSMLPVLPKVQFKPTFKIPIEKLKEEEAYLRDLRIRLRDLLMKVLGNKKFEIFVKPNDKNPDPNDELIWVHQILENVNDKKYSKTQQIINDFQFFVDNHTLYADEIAKVNNIDPLLYNKVKSKAHDLFDSVEFSVNQFPRDLKKKCNEIFERRLNQQLEESKEKIQEEPKTNETELVNEEIILNTEKQVETIIEQKTNEMDKQVHLETIIEDGIQQEEKIEPPKELESVEESKEPSVEESKNGTNGIVEDVMIVEDREVEFDEKRFAVWFNKLINQTIDFKIPELDQIYCQIYGTIYRFKDDWNKDELLDDFEKILKK